MRLILVDAAVLLVKLTSGPDTCRPAYSVKGSSESSVCRAAGELPKGETVTVARLVRMLVRL